jgi:hypothetical protein
VVGDVVIEFAEERRALAFERYLKSGSGVAFARGICDSWGTSRLSAARRRLSAPTNG